MKEDLYFRKLAKLKAEADQCRARFKKLGQQNEPEESAKLQAKAMRLETKIQAIYDKLDIHSGQLHDKECYHRAMGKLEKAEKVAGRIKTIKRMIKENQKN